MTNVLFTDDLVQLKCRETKCFRPTQFCIIKYTSLLIFNVGRVLSPQIGMEM